MGYASGQWFEHRETGQVAVVDQVGDKITLIPADSLEVLFETPEGMQRWKAMQQTHRTPVTGAPWLVPGAVLVSREEGARYRLQVKEFCAELVLMELQNLPDHRRYLVIEPVNKVLDQYEHLPSRFDRSPLDP